MDTFECITYLFVFCTLCTSLKVAIQSMENVYDSRLTRMFFVNVELELECRIRTIFPYVSI